MPKTKNKIKKFIAPDERVAAAKFLALGNLALDDYIPRYNGDVIAAYSAANGVLYSETGESADGEMKSWKKLIDRGDEYCYDEWEKAKPQLKW